VLGILFLALALALNPWSVASWLSADGSLDGAGARVIVWGQCLVLAAVGLLLLRRGRRALLGLLAAALAAAAGLGVAEIGFRLVDPFPYISWHEERRIADRNPNASQYDPEIGWVGTPGIEIEFATRHSRTTVRHNAQGFRDIEASMRSAEKPALVFLGDSFTWGFEVEFDEMFVQLLRDDFPEHEVFNLGHRAYGTDQALLTFRRWRSERPLARVVLLFCENDLADNAGYLRWQRPKPYFEPVDGRLELRNVPVPPSDWAERPATFEASPSPLERFAALAYRSHLVHDVCFRLSTTGIIRWDLEPSRQVGGEASRPAHLAVEGIDPLGLAEALIAELAWSAAERGAPLSVVAIPHKAQFEPGSGYRPYQERLKPGCRAAGADYLDLAPAFAQTRLRTYFRTGMHWNPRGHRVAAEALTGHLRAVLAR